MVRRMYAMAVAGLLLGGCAAVTAGSYVTPRAGLTGYATYAWAPDDETPTGDPRLDSNPFVRERVRTGVDRELSTRGYLPAAGGIPDLMVHIHMSVTQVIDTSLIDQQFCVETDCRPFVYQAGTIVVDLVDAVTNTLVWRGWAESNLGDLIDDQAALDRRVDESVTRILARLPPAL
jgi:hypothetical protein